MNRNCNIMRDYAFPTCRVGDFVTTTTGTGIIPTIIRKDTAGNVFPCADATRAVIANGNITANAKREWFRVTRDTAEEVDIDVYGDIGESTDWWTGEKEGMGAKEFLDAIREAKGKAVNLHVNSGGGSVVDAYAMMTAIAAHDGKVTAYVDGLAASAASYLVAAADEVVMSSVAWMMIHDATMICWGGAEDMRDAAEYLDKTNRHIAEIYAKRSASRDAAEFAEAMAETTWFTAEEALEWGLVDRVEEAVAAAACATGDAATLESAPEGARDLCYRYGTISSSHIATSKTTACDTHGSIPTDSGEPEGQEPPAAKDRAAVINGKLVRIKERGENA